MTRFGRGRFALCLALLAGCSGRPARVHVPELDPQAAAAEALRLYDTNNDTAIDATEWKACPGLASCAKWVDTDRDGKLSAEEIAARVQSYLDQRVGVMSFTCTISQGGKAVPGAEVTLEPEPFLGSSIKSARGTTRPDGSVAFLMEGSELAGVQPGMYRVKVSKRNASGAESLPAKVNEQTTLGVEANSGMLSDDEHRATRGLRL